MTSETEPGAFWDFTLESYRREGVQQAVIALQDRRGADVNVLFFCCYVAAEGRGRLRPEDFAAAEAEIEPWRRQVTLPLRALRDRIKGTEALWSLPGAAEARGKVLGAEIESERVAQGLLERLIPAGDADRRAEQARLRDAVENLWGYLAFLTVEPDARDHEALGRLLWGTFPDCSVTELAAALG